MKAVLSSKRFLVDGSMAADITTSAVPTAQDDLAAMQFNYTGSSPVGNLKVQASLDYIQDENGNILNTGNWVDLYVSVNGAAPAINIAIPGATTPILIDLTIVSMPYVRAVYTRASGTGTMNGYVCKKRIGD